MWHVYGMRPKHHHDMQAVLACEICTLPIEHQLTLHSACWQMRGSISCNTSLLPAPAQHAIILAQRDQVEQALKSRLYFNTNPRTLKPNRRDFPPDKVAVTHRDFSILGGRGFGQLFTQISLLI